jgi:alpha-methylacyl-CoA racemase
MTGWGQSGPLAHTAGHDLTYLAVTGVLHAAGGRPPANLLGDYGGGGMLLAAGLLAALLRAQRTGQGQVVDAAIVDGASLLATQLYGLRHGGLWGDEPGSNLLDGGAPFYTVYPAADGRSLAVGALEPPFFAALLAGLGLDPDEVPGQYSVPEWPRLRALIGQRLATRTRDEWVAAFAGTDACVAPVLGWDEAAAHPQLAQRQVLREEFGVRQPAPAPRFSQTPAPGPRRPPPYPGEHTREALARWCAESAPDGFSGSSDPGGVRVGGSHDRRTEDSCSLGRTERQLRDDGAGRPGGPARHGWCGSWPG